MVKMLMVFEPPEGISFLKEQQWKLLSGRKCPQYCRHFLCIRVKGSPGLFPPGFLFQLSLRFVEHGGKMKVLNNAGPVKAAVIGDAFQEVFAENFQLFQ